MSNLDNITWMIEDGAPIFAVESMACCSDSSCNSPKVLYGGQLQATFCSKEDVCSGC